MYAINTSVPVECILTENRTALSNVTAFVDGQARGTWCPYDAPHDKLMPARPQHAMMPSTHDTDKRSGATLQFGSD